MKKNAIQRSFLAMGTFALAITVAGSFAQADVLFYNAADATLPTVVDSSGSGNNGTAGAGVTVVSDSPAAFPGGMSFVFDGVAENKINTDATLLLENSLIVGAGGFTMDTWLKTDGVGLGFAASVIDYAGTDRIQFDDTGAISFATTAGTVTSSVSVTDNAWHHVTATFTVTDGSDLAAVVGDLSFTVDGVTEAPLVGGAMTDFGDSLNRTIGIGGHPQGFGGDVYVGSLYNPNVSLGVTTAVPEPGAISLLCLAGLAGIARRRRS